MEPKEKQEETAKKSLVVHITILIVIVSLMAITALLANSNFNFVDFVIKLH